MTRADRESLILGEAAMGRVGWHDERGMCPGCAINIRELLAGYPELARCLYLDYRDLRAATPDEVAQWLAERGER